VSQHKLLCIVATCYSALPLGMYPTVMETITGPSLNQSNGCHWRCGYLHVFDDGGLNATAGVLHLTTCRCSPKMGDRLADGTRIRNLARGQSTVSIDPGDQYGFCWSMWNTKRLLAAAVNVVLVPIGHCPILQSRPCATGHKPALLTTSSLMVLFQQAVRTRVRADHSQ